MSPFDAAHFNEKMMKGVFAKIYPVIAEDLLDRCGIRSGLCLDLGGGPGMLAVRIAEISDLQVIVVDPVAECIELAEENAAEHGQCGQVTAQLGHAEKLDFADNSVDLVVSRGSVYFWDDQAAGLREIYRVLRPGDGRSLAVASVTPNCAMRFWPLWPTTRSGNPDARNAPRSSHRPISRICWPR